MIEAFYSPGLDVNQYCCGPLKPHIDPFALQLSRLVYSTSVGRWKIRLVADLSRWLECGQMGTRDLNERQIGAVFALSTSESSLTAGSRLILLHK